MVEKKAVTVPSFSAGTEGSRVVINKINLKIKYKNKIIPKFKIY
jgi:hypothetical protein